MKGVSKRGIFEGFLTFLVVVVLPGLVVWLFLPCWQYEANGKRDKTLPPDTFFVNATKCSEGCRKLVSQSYEVDLSIILPAYNEELRLPSTLDTTLTFMADYSRLKGISFEILVVDDCSTDKTGEVVLTYARKQMELSSSIQAADKGTANSVGDSGADIRLLSLSRNHGKGGAIQRGVMYSRGRNVLFADADGATDITTALDKLWSALHTRKVLSPKYGTYLGMVVGSRAHLERDSIAVRKWYRTVLMHGFHFLVKVLGTSQIKDTQCGFKLFTKQAAKLLFTNIHLEGWVFDIELIYLAERMGIPMAEEAVVWREVEGSKLIVHRMDVIWTSLRMARDMACMRLAYALGLWKVMFK